MAIPPVFLPVPATQVPSTETAAWDISSEVASADDLPGLNSKSTIQSPCTTFRLDAISIIEESFIQRDPHSLSVGTEGQHPTSLGQQSVRQTSIPACCA